MSADTQQLVVICEEIETYFANHPFIAVRPAKGDPPDQYEATYSIQGICKDDSGRLQVSSHHVVSIAIPSGFPHIPPRCRPLTPIFHPDFDPAAIRLGGFWNNARSLPELIIFIGSMISGELFSKEHAPNQDAAAWYLGNTEKLPFSRLLNRSDANPSASLSTERVAEPMEINAIEEAELLSDLSQISRVRTAESPTSQNDTSSTDHAETPGSDIDLATIWLLVGQKRFYQLRNILKNPAGTIFFDGKEEVADQIRTSIQAARQIYKEGEDLELRGLPAQALEKFTAVEQLVSDFPKIDEDIRRTEQAKELLGDWVQGKEDTSPQKTASPLGKTGANNKKQRAGTPLPVDRKPSRFFSSLQRINFVPVALFAGLLSVTVPPAYVYLSDTGRYDQALRLYSECTGHIHNRRFNEATEDCSAALKLAQDITIFNKQESNELTGKIDALLNSEDLRQGLAGNVLVNGAYFPQTLAETLNSIRKTMDEGDRLAAGAHWEKAIEMYRNGILKLEKEPQLDPSVLGDLKLKLHRVQSQLSIEKGIAAMQKKLWQQAIDHFDNASTQIQPLPPDEQKDIRASLQPQLDKSTFLLLKQQGDTLFASADWTGAFTSFQQAINLGVKLDQAEEITLNAIQTDIVRADLYATIKAGKVAFAKNEWNAAIEQFARASKILMDNPQLLDQEDAARNLRKLSRIMLQASIIRDQQQVEKRIAEKQYREAIKILHQIAGYIDRSPLKAEKEFAEIRRKVGETLATTREAQVISDKKTYLEEHFRAFFAENYPAALPESLTSPVITFIKEEEDKLLFKMQCTESGRGKPMNLIMYYSFAKTTGAWGFHSETAE
ncbi:hypothetical protein JWG42_04625 [Desulfoprunum benzoelyticum]|uniref:UBC core domain-containing protein n=1 Tax=Desulfoprunum benzoelyticum TaxID=1506996 RepID=A0A840UMA1_9BACT|nr:hypothetical protein [Desulfoprunum benzoelyticum]MBB5346902.1 hypothetical protein [Desulfoprunum benzoelyticum]MBM9529436.1 hypothetical protein [Desulfoprunum benzoelyticum]